MKRLGLAIMAAFFVLSINAQYVSDFMTVDNQYPGDQKAEKVYQSAVDKQQNLKTSALRTTWVANTPGSNWFISLEGGLAYLGTEGFRNVDLKDMLKPTGGIALGKWFSPVWGLRLNVTGAKLQGYALGEGGGTWYVGRGYNGPGDSKSDGGYITGNTPETREYIINHFYNTNAPYKNGYRYDLTYVGTSLDFLVNLKNAFTPYNPKAFFNPVVYAGLGYARTLKDKDKDISSINSIYEKAGLQLNFRLSDRWDFYLAGEGMILPEVFDRQVGGDMTHDILLNAKLGFTYRFNFRHFIKAPLVDQDQLDALNKEINDLRNRPQVVCPPVVVCPEAKAKEVVEKVEKEVELTPVFFTINSYTVHDNQLLSVAKAAQYLLNKPNAKLEISAYADKNTGKAPYNLKLSEKRADAVVKILVQKFGIEKSRLTVTFHGDKIQPFAENDQNRVAIFVR
jgi:outer membrane protein OmpA-like peptidoglycan-associated protein